MPARACRRTEHARARGGHARQIARAAPAQTQMQYYVPSGRRLKSDALQLATLPSLPMVRPSLRARLNCCCKLTRPNKMAANKNRRAHNIIEEKGLDIDFKAITFTTFGGFGEGTHELIKKITNDTDWNCNDPWVKPSPNSHAYLTFGFALARANARMLLHADSRRRSAKNRVRTTRPRSTLQACLVMNTGNTGFLS